jgi:hypothetical protein
MNASMMRSRPNLPLPAAGRAADFGGGLRAMTKLLNGPSFYSM